MVSIPLALCHVVFLTNFVNRSQRQWMFLTWYGPGRSSSSSDIDFITHNDITDEQRYDHFNKPVLPEHFDAKHTSATVQSNREKRS